MRFLLDENLEGIVATTASVYGHKNQDEFIHIGEIASLGTHDRQIPSFASANHCDCLITVNVRDFGAKKFYYEALMAEDLHVCVLRPGKVKFRGDQQISLLMRNYESIRQNIAVAASAILMIVGWSGVRVRTIDQLVEEFDEGNRLP